jgi:PAS domain S-box-containing protein
MHRLIGLLNDLPIKQKLLLASVVPILALTLLSLLIYRSVGTFAEDEEQLNNIYIAQGRAAEYMGLVADLETGFRGYVLTRQESYLRPYLIAQNRILNLGDMLEQMVSDREAQRAVMHETQLLVKQLMNEKDAMIKAVRAGHLVDALHYIQEGRGRTIMLSIREHMARFNRLDQEVVNAALAKISRDRSLMTWAILGGSFLALALMALALHLIARSITGPLVTVAQVVGTVRGGTVPQVPVFERRDEIGDLTRVMAAMSAQLRDHISRVEKSEAELRTLNFELAASESKYRTIVDHAPFGIFTTNGLSLLFSNRYNRILAGLNPDEEGDLEAITQAIHPEDRERVLSQYAVAMEQQRAYETIFRFLHKDGTVRKVLSRMIPITDADSRTVMYQGFNIDITALDQMQARLSRAERLATLGQVAAGIAHEIRNPLVGIGSTASLLLDDAAKTDPHRADFEIILNETKRLDRIVNQILEYARPRTLAPVAFAMEDLLQETLTLLEGALGIKQIKIERQIPPGLPKISADRDQIKQVLLNVAQNAIEAMKESGTLRVAAFDCPRENQPGLMVQISDTGGGIRPEDLSRVFEPFFTAGKHQGTGLGLAICHNIIESHHGDIVVDSQPDVGTTVQVWLPLRQEPQVSLL